MSENDQIMGPPAKKAKLDEKLDKEEIHVERNDNEFTEDVDIDNANNAFSSSEDKYSNFVTAEELDKLREFHVLDEVKSNDEDSNNEGDSDSSDDKSVELPEDEIEKMLDEDLPEDFKGAPKPKEKPYSTRQKVILEDKGVNPFEVLPLDWMIVRHYSGMPVYMHRASRVCTLSKPYFLGKGNTRRHEIPISAIPCLAYRKALEEEEKQKEIDRQIEEQIKNGTWSQKTDANNIKNLNKDKNDKGDLVIEIDDKTDSLNEANDVIEKQSKCPIRHGAAITYETDAQKEKTKYNTNKDCATSQQNDGNLVNELNDNSEKNHQFIDDQNIKTNVSNNFDGDNQSTSTNKETKDKSTIYIEDEKQYSHSTSKNEDQTEDAQNSPVIDYKTKDSHSSKNDVETKDSHPNGTDKTKDGQSVNEVETEDGPSNGADKTKDGQSSKNEVETEDGPLNGADKTKDGQSVNEVETEDADKTAHGGDIPLSRQPVVLPGGLVMPPPRVETVSTSWKAQHLTHEQLTDYCRSLFKFKTVNIMHFKRWADRRKYTKARKTLQYPTLPEGTKLITIPAQTGLGQENGGKAAKRDWVMNMNGRSYLSVFHEYVRRALQKQPVYEFKQLENASMPYQASVLIGGMQYGVGRGSSKRAAKAAAARASIHILIPEMRDDLEPSDGQPKLDRDKPETDFSFFDYVSIEDPRITEFCAATCEPSPHAILRTCLLRNFGAGDRHIHTEMKKLEYQKIELTMKVGKHSAKVVCKNKKAAKQRASQAILQALHPHVRSWGSLLRLYGSRSVKSSKEKKLEEQQITLLQDSARHNEPNYAVLEKLRNEMRKLRERDDAVVPIGTLLVKDDLPTHSGSNLNNVDL